jgi:hypothetical protein
MDRPDLPPHRCEPKSPERVAIHRSRGWREIAHAPDIASARARKQIAERAGDQVVIESDIHGGWLVITRGLED